MNSPEVFDFPFPPYDIQFKFMKSLYETLENEKLGIFESPTGTGKSLSIICGALRWLTDHEMQKRQNLEKEIKLLQSKLNTEDNSEDWITAQSLSIKNTHKIITLKSELQKMDNYNQKITKIKSKKSEIRRKRPENNQELDVPEEFEDHDLLLEDIKQKEEDEEIEEEDTYTPTKIYFCSRTHSQLSQFVGEIQKSPFSQTRVTTLASRQTYCVNPIVRKLNSLSLINERCLDFQKRETTTCKDPDGQKRKKQKNKTGCPYLSQTGTEEFKNEILGEIIDVEQLVAIGKDSKVCPYYGSRAAVEDAQIVVLPYNTLLHKSTRAASGIKLKNNIVIIDEAHNLLDTIGNIHSCEVTGHQLSHAYSQIVQYRDKYQSKFAAKNLLRINQIIYVLSRFIKYIGGKPGEHYTTKSTNKTESKMYTLQDFTSSTEINSINLFKLVEFCELSKLSHKLHNFSEKYQTTVTIHPIKKQQSGLEMFLTKLSKIVPENGEEKEEPEEFITTNPMVIVITFMECLTNSCKDGRILTNIQTTVGKSSLKFVLLNPASHFEDIVKEAKSVIVAGGTMQPISEFKNDLFIKAGASEDRIVEFMCGHVIPKENILPMILCSGPSNQIFDFSYQERESSQMINELGRFLQNIVQIVPGGIVVFFPSYSYEKFVYNHLETSKIVSKLESKKVLFREPKLSSQVDSVLEKYSKCISHPEGSKNGALLFSVVGGKLSEGLNFSDDLGRCVIVIGLPYPNIKSLELQEKMAYLEKQNPGSGKIHYENLCMKAVNQCIGRAVRHKGDYASVVLLDQRYSRPSVQNLLPGWIRNSLVAQNKFGPVAGLLAKFFRSKRTGNQ